MILIVSIAESERREKARLHDEAMWHKYSQIQGRFDAYTDYHYWDEALCGVNASYSAPVAPQRDYPLPYSEKHYFRRFAELFFRRGAEDSIKLRLAHEFIGDETDADYINGLLIKAEDYGFFTPGAKILFEADGVAMWRPLKPGERYSHDREHREWPHEIYEGSKANKDRAKVIRQWLKGRARKLTATNPPAAVASLDAFPSTLAASPEATPSPWAPLLIGALSLPGFFDFLVSCGLILGTGELTPLGAGTGKAKDRKAPWAGTLDALIEAKLLYVNVAAICRALNDPAGRLNVQMAENTLRERSDKSDGYFAAANEHLRVLGLLRK